MKPFSKILDENKVDRNMLYYGINLNTINETETGNFDIHCINKPPFSEAGEGGYLSTYKISDDYLIQIAIGGNSGEEYRRMKKANNNWGEWYKTVIDDRSSTSSISALSANQGRAIEGILQGKQSKSAIIYCANQNQTGLLITFPNNGIYSMIAIKMWGNGYSVLSPIDTVIQGYHYEPLGNFINCKQRASGGLGTASFGIINSKICCYIPDIGVYTTFIIDTTYQGVLNNPSVTVSICTSKPTMEYERTCTIV